MKKKKSTFAVCVKMVAIEMSSGFVATHVICGFMACVWISLQAERSASSGTSARCAAARKRGVDIAKWPVSLASQN